MRLFEEKASGAQRDRPELGRMLDHLRAGDVVKVTRGRYTEAYKRLTGTDFSL